MVVVTTTRGLQPMDVDFDTALIGRPETLVTFAGWCETATVCARAQNPCRRCGMPGKFIQEVHIYQCGQHSDGTAIMCSEIGYAKIPFLELEDASSGDASMVGWQSAGYNDVYLPLTRLVSAMKQLGIAVSYDEADLARRLGPPPESA
jgi:hypothetical protein